MIGGWALARQQRFMVVMFVVGLGLTGLGTFWTQLRTALMQRLPNFPGKSRLPPYIPE